MADEGRLADLRMSSAQKGELEQLKDHEYQIVRAMLPTRIEEVD